MLAKWHKLHKEARTVLLFTAHAILASCVLIAAELGDCNVCLSFFYIYNKSRGSQQSKALCALLFPRYNKYNHLHVDWYNQWLKWAAENNLNQPF